MPMLKLENLKSAVEIVDPEEIWKRVTQVQEEGKPGLKGQTFFSRLKDGKVKVEKMTGLSIMSGDGAPAMPDNAAIEQLAKKRGIRWDDEYLDRKQMWWLSDERVDGSGDIVRANWLFDEFEDNSPIAFSHEWGGMPIGKFIDWRVTERRSEKYSGPALWTLGLFALGSELQRQEQVRRLVQAGMMPGCSAGFYSDKVIDIKDDAERQQLGLGRYGFILDMNHLLEGSPTMLGCNPGALAIFTNAAKKGLLKAADFTFIRDAQRTQIRKSKGDKAAWEEVDGKTLAVAKILFPDIDFRPHPNFDEPFESEEEIKLRHFTPPAPKAAESPAKKTGEEQLAELAAKFAEHQANVEIWMLSSTRMIEDIRNIIEEAAATPALASHREEAEVEGGGESGAASRKEEDGEPETKNRRVLKLVLERLPKTLKR